jgi:GST-like protein
MTNLAEYTPPKIWTWSQENGGAWASINRPVSGATHDKELPVGRHPLQLYSLGTPNGVKVTVMLEHVLALEVGARITTKSIRALAGRRPRPGRTASPA